MSHEQCSIKDMETPLTKAFLSLSAASISEIKHHRMQMAHFHGSNLRGKMLTIFLLHEEFKISNYSPEVQLAEKLGDIAIIQFSNSQLKQIQKGNYIRFDLKNSSVDLLVQYGEPKP